MPETEMNVEIPEVAVTSIEETEIDWGSLIQSNAKIEWRKMTPETKGELVHTITHGMAEVCQEKDIAWVKLGIYWAFIMKNKVYRYAGEHIRTANGFLKELDLGISGRELRNYAALAEIYRRVIRLRNVSLPIRKLALVQQMISKGGDQEEWIEKAISMPLSALENESREVRGLQPRDTCSHPEESQEVWMRCGICGAWLRKVESDIESIIGPGEPV
jgi:hypothetical protein